MRRIGLVVAVFAIAAAACGNGDDSIGTDPSAAGVEEVVRAGTTATFRGDWSTVHSLLTDECQAEYGVGDIAATLTIGIAFAAGFMGLEPDELASLEVGDVEVFDLVEGQSARAVSSLEQDGELFSQWTPSRRQLHTSTRAAAGVLPSATSAMTLGQRR